MKVDGKEIKDMTKEEMKEYLDFVESNPLANIVASTLYGSVENLKGMINKELEQTNKERHLENNSNSGIIKNSNKIRQNKVENNINKKCKIVNHPYLKDNTEGVIKDKVDLTQQYVVVVNDKDIMYVDKENVEIIKDEWKDIILQEHCNELNMDYTIVIKEDLNTIVHTVGYVLFQKRWREYNFKLPELKSLIKNYKENKNSIIEYVLGKVKIQQYKKQSDNIDTQLNNLQKQQNQIQDKINKEEIKMKDIIGERVDNLEQ